ncbi:hypothetical protein KKH23_06890, partial [Patescibacteria group bacterium]|nr:hypothetical protein [Patescibacteria group bacterium]
MRSGLAFHVHHDRLMEYCYDYDERVGYIKTGKPAEEQELRLRLFKLIPLDRIPGKDSKIWEAHNKAGEALDKAREAYYKAREAYDKAREAYDEAREAYDEAREAYGKAYSSEIVALHKELCPDCPWDGTTIFS